MLQQLKKDDMFVRKLGMKKHTEYALSTSGHGALLRLKFTRAMANASSIITALS